MRLDLLASVSMGPKIFVSTREGKAPSSLKTDLKQVEQMRRSISSPCLKNSELNRYSGKLGSIHGNLKLTKSEAALTTRGLKDDHRLTDIQKSVLHIHCLLIEIFDKHLPARKLALSQVGHIAENKSLRLTVSEKQRSILLNALQRWPDNKSAVEAAQYLTNLTIVKESPPLKFLEMNQEPPAKRARIGSSSGIGLALSKLSL